MSLDNPRNDLDSEQLLKEGSESSSHTDFDEYLANRRYESRQTLGNKYGGIFLIVVLVATNLGWWWVHLQAHYIQHSGQHPLGPPDLKYFLEGKDPEHILYPFEHDWADLELVELGDDDYRYGDVHWRNAATFPQGGAVVAVSQQFVEENNLLPGAAPTLGNASEFHYLVAGYHQLHCLSVVRDAIYYLNGTLEWADREGASSEEPFMWDHVIHCIEAVRQGLACNLDPSLIPLDSYWPGIPNGQMHVCRNRDALYKWTNKHGSSLPEHTKQAPPARSQEWHDRTKHMNLPPWEPNPYGPPVDLSIHN